jgi:hypothetical protein
MTSVQGERASGRAIPRLFSNHMGGQTCYPVTDGFGRHSIRPGRHQLAR